MAKTRAIKLVSNETVFNDGGFIVGNGFGRIVATGIVGALDEYELQLLVGDNEYAPISKNGVEWVIDADNTLFEITTPGTYRLQQRGDGPVPSPGVQISYFEEETGIKVSQVHFSADAAPAGGGGGGGDNLRLFADANVAGGVDAMPESGTQSRSVALGDLALNLAVDASGVIAIGYGAGEEAVGAENGVFIGDSAGAIGPSVGAVAIGASAMSVGNNPGAVAVGLGAISSGSGNDNTVAAGYDAFRQASNSASAVAVGYQALYNASGLTGVVAIGATALNLLTTGANNVAVGYRAGAALTTGQGNTFVGHQAGDVATGNNNVLVGANAGGALTAGAANILIGSGPANAAFTSGDANITIGHSTSLNSGSQNVVLIGTATTTSGSPLGNAVAIGANCMAARSNEVRIGNDTMIRALFQAQCFLLPKIDTTTRNAITGAYLEDGLLIYNTTTTQFEKRLGGAWVAF